ncbi:MAG: hypothetical protein UV74_C0013G0451 [Candidatus Woesebacteria bacterium GW2011_GWB1_43_14]|uniref:Nucleoside phosphorylase domain-containing protein n=1 Tax=Candidatus Woesebacteria bacterium GW2011_GWB1_43_14 TaxID=1618578 RepID=A0A0G1DI06_9BACT|nr:MAG: hypothetical protein UT21_C0001G0163 [Candidatus Woesebacteria bacterium GW2011_GWA1_39_11b]KKS77492.1 MAG: hypothetical protein UV51_C0006G0009 [Candidatus Woesebacteria bacterium GW2011_GWC1_42_9]KKS97329.1 MAG: hypothetical protein UV74_C0013G0451 [Candidatus Woesebacteria bacterium GW2011_GWB1_43_14]
MKNTLGKADFASITGSPLWGVSVNRVKLGYIQRGWECNFDGRPDTPYGIGPRTIVFNTMGRNILWIPSYGGVSGQDWHLHETQHKVFWILWKAGVKVLIIGGTSGIADWRKEGKILPGDIVLPWSFRTSPNHRGLPGTEYETSWPKYDLTLDDPFCTVLAEDLQKETQKHLRQIGKVHTPDNVRVALVVPDGITFETNYDILMWMAINKMASSFEPDKPPIVSLHGDCINPVLARLLGIHVAYYHMVANVAQGLPMEESITESLYRLYVNNFPEVAFEMEANLLENISVPNGSQCACITSLHQAPEVFSSAMTEAQI